MTFSHAMWCFTNTILKTRFGSNFIMVDWLLQIKTALQQSIIDPQWVIYVTGLRDTHTMKVGTVSRKVKEIVLNEQFWEHCTNFWKLVAVVMWTLWDFDGKDLCMGKILHIFCNLEKNILSLKGEPYMLDHNLANAM